jgi:hypothetical protein
MVCAVRGSHVLSKASCPYLCSLSEGLWTITTRKRSRQLLLLTRSLVLSTTSTHKHQETVTPYPTQSTVATIYQKQSKSTQQNASTSRTQGLLPRTGSAYAEDYIDMKAQGNSNLCGRPTNTQFSSVPHQVEFEVCLPQLSRIRVMLI